MHFRKIRSIFVSSNVGFPTLINLTNLTREVRTGRCRASFLYPTYRLRFPQPIHSARLSDRHSRKKHEKGIGIFNLFRYFCINWKIMNLNAEVL
uniref:Uncharacterized protein n=1 Tax=Siphoviridae sp. ctBLh2 TaxID=2827803 RepID=A0A8S5S443_9CAUD|nr:MAG TPA: hypothetical protein [Siphoviridae sp. ctBLh2]